MDITTSESVGKIAMALNQAQMSMGKLVVDGVNPHFKSKFATLACVCAVCNPPLANAGIAVVHSGAIIDGKPGVACMFLHESGEWIKGVMEIGPADSNDPQKRVSAMTYGRRCLMGAMCNVAPEEDDDGNSAAAPPKPKAKQEPKWVKVCKANDELKAAVKSLGMTKGELNERWGLAKGDTDKFTEDVIALASLTL